MQKKIYFKGYITIIVVGFLMVLIITLSAEEKTLSKASDLTIKPQTIVDLSKSRAVDKKSMTVVNCSKKVYCKDISNCEEALYYLNVCKIKRLDRDKDGIPCESICK